VEFKFYLVILICRKLKPQAKLEIELHTLSEGEAMSISSLKPYFALLLVSMVLAYVIAISLHGGKSTAAANTTAKQKSVFPGATWERRTPEQAGLVAAQLDEVKNFVGGRGCVVRGGYLIYTWGDPAMRGDVASAAKPWYAHFLFKAVEEKLLPGVDARAVEFEPRLSSLNPELNFKDRLITFRHFATQTSCYGVGEAPGTAYNYNDYQMALFLDLLFLKIYRATYETVDEKVLHPLLTESLQCEDTPTLLAFGVNDRAGRLAVSPRDFARFGLLYLREGNWNGKQLISRKHARMAVSEPLPLSLPRTKAKEAAMITGQRSIGSKNIPDDHNDHNGSYSWLWWVNGIKPDGTRRWPGAPDRVFACLGHKNGKRGLAVLPELDLIISWNDSRFDVMPEEPHPVGEMLRRLTSALKGK
jgi:hypothetical protein